MQEVEQEYIFIKALYKKLKVPFEFDVELHDMILVTEYNNTFIHKKNDLNTVIGYKIEDGKIRIPQLISLRFRLKLVFED